MQIKPEFRFCQKQSSVAQACCLSRSKAILCVSSGHHFRQTLCQSSKMMLAGPLLINARPQSAVVPQNIFGRSKQTQSLRTRSIGATGNGASSAPATGGILKGAFFNRLNEMAEIKETLDDDPGPITVLVGPPSCGKTVRSAILCKFLAKLGGAAACWRRRQLSFGCLTPSSTVVFNSFCIFIIGCRDFYRR